MSRERESHHVVAWFATFMHSFLSLRQFAEVAARHKCQVLIVTQFWTVFHAPSFANVRSVGPTFLWKEYPMAKAARIAAPNSVAPPTTATPIAVGRSGLQPNAHTVVPPPGARPYDSAPGTPRLSGRTSIVFRSHARRSSSDPQSQVPAETTQCVSLQTAQIGSDDSAGTNGANGANGAGSNDALS